MKTRHGDKKREIMWDSSKPSSTEIVPVLTERNAHSIFTTNCSFCLLRFSHVLYSTHEKYISLALEQQKTVKLLHYNSITIRFRSIWWRLREIENLTSWRSRHFTYLGVFLSNSLYLYISRNTHSFHPIIYTWRLLEVSIQKIITNKLDQSRDLFHDYHWCAYRFFVLTLIYI